MIAHDPKVTEQADIEGRNALMWAAGKGCKEVVKTLLGIRTPTIEKNPGLQKDAGANDNSENEHVLEFTPMDVNKLDNKGNTGLETCDQDSSYSSLIPESYRFSLYIVERIHEFSYF